MDGVIDTLGERELPKEFGILRQGGHLVSLRGMPDGEFARRMGMSFVKRSLFPLAEVNQALQKVAAGGSNGKTVLRIG